MKASINVKSSKVKYVIILVLLIAIIFQTLAIVKYNKTIYSNNTLSYSTAMLELTIMTDNLRSPDIANKDKEQIIMSEKEIVNIVNELRSGYHSIYYINNMIIPTNKKSHYIKQIMGKLDFVLRELPSQFINNKDITYSDAKRLIDDLDALRHSMEAELAWGNKPNIELTEAQTEDILKKLDKLSQYNVK